jgi:hypothetical protein
MMAGAAPQTIVQKYNLEKDLEKLGLDKKDKDPNVQLLLERASEKGILDEEFFLEVLKVTVANSALAQGKTLDTQLFQEIQRKLLIDRGLNQQDRALILLNKENLAVAKVTPTNADLNQPMGKSTSYIIHDDQYQNGPIGKILYDGQTLTMAPYNNAYKSGQEKCLRSLMMAAKAAYGEGTEIHNPYFTERHEDKFRSSRDDNGVSKAYYHQQRDFMLAAVSNGFKIPNKLEALLLEKPESRRMLEEAKEQWKRVVDQRGPQKSTQPALQVAGTAQTQTPTPSTTPGPTISPNPSQ